MNNDFEYCDECGQIIPRGEAHYFAEVPVDLASVNAGESATLCSNCCEMYVEELNADDENPAFMLSPPLPVAPALVLMNDPHNSGFMMTFANGVTVSVRWGSLTYSDRGQTTAELAALRGQTFIRVPGFEYQGDDVLPNVLPEEVARFIYEASVLRPE